MTMNSYKEVEVLLVEDDPVMNGNYTDFIKGNGYKVRAFQDRITALTSIRRRLPDIAVLDVALGHERDGGYKLCRDIRTLSKSLPIMFLTSYDSELDIISGLRLGADECVSKEESFELLQVRIESLLERRDTLESCLFSIEEVGPLKIDKQSSQVFWNNQLIDFNLTQTWIISKLVQKPGQICSISSLMSAAQLVVEPNTISVHIKRIRNRFKELDLNFNSIQTVRGRGYRWLIHTN